MVHAVSPCDNEDDNEDGAREPDSESEADSESETDSDDGSEDGNAADETEEIHRCSCLEIVDKEQEAHGVARQAEEDERNSHGERRYFGALLYLPKAYEGFRVS